MRQPMPSTRYATAFMIGFTAEFNAFMLILYKPRNWSLFLLIFVLLNVTLIRGQHIET